MTPSNDPFAALPAPIASALRARGFTELTPVQRAVLEAESTGRDLRVSSQTGSGKTVAIGIALAAHFLEGAGRPGSIVDAGAASPKPEPKTPPRKPRASAARPTALVVVPTRELAAQVQGELKWLYANLRDLRVEVVTGGTSIEGERRALARGPGLIVGTPGRLLDHIRNHAIDCGSIEHVILDEADQMLDMGFREELEGILEQLPESRSSHLVSATFPRAVVSLADRFQKNVLAIEGTRLGVANADIQHIAYSIRRHETYAALVNVLLLAGDSRCLLFVNRRVDATVLAEKLASDGFGAAPFSGELAQAQRTRTLAAFRNGTFNILVSTDVAARGIDVPDISTVVHIDPPRTSDAYIHRSGRTGRAGRTGKSILLVAGPDMRRVTRLLQVARVEVSWQPVPRPEKVEKALEKQARRAMHARLAEAAPSERQLAYARQLLEDRDPVEVVATLLEMSKAKPPREPMALVGLDPFANDRPRKRGARGAGARPAGSSGEKGGGRDFGKRGTNGRSADPSPGRVIRKGRTGFTRFTISWGERTGATPSRLLSHVCRRGGLSSEQVGAIEIASKSSTIDVASDVADAFESRARRPDRRDPGIVIQREERPGRVAGRMAKSGRVPTSSERPPPGPAREQTRSTNPTFTGRPHHLKRKNARRTASR